MTKKKLFDDIKQNPARIYRFDWPRMWADGNLDHAVLDDIDDDAAVQGCRPEFVRHDDRWLLATADYGQVRNAVRLYDPALLAGAKSTSERGGRTRRAAVSSRHLSRPAPAKIRRSRCYATSY